MFTNIPLILNLGESGPLTWDMAKQIIQSQSNLAIIGIAVLVGIGVLLLGGSWIWHFRLHKRELEEAVESLKSALTAERKKDFVELTTRVEDEVEKIKKEIGESVTKRMTEFDAEKARLFALAAEQSKAWERASFWWAEAIEGYAKAKSEKGVRIAVDALNNRLGKCKKLKDDFKESIKKHLSFIPKILGREKEQIEDKLKKLPKETTEQSETRPN